MMTSKFLADAEIERRANRLLGRYEVRSGPISNPPIPVEHILEDVLDLSILWDTIPETPGQSILAGLDPGQSRLILVRGKIQGSSSSGSLTSPENGQLQHKRREFQRVGGLSITFKPQTRANVISD